MHPNISPRALVLTLACVIASSTACGDTSSSSAPQEQLDCDAEPIIRTTDDGIEFVRTPTGCFDDLPEFPYELKYVEIDGLRQGYVDQGPANAPVVLLLHGQPTWAFLYRKMIPVLVDAGYRAIAMDHLGMGFSDTRASSLATAPCRSCPKASSHTHASRTPTKSTPTSSSSSS